jgi:hypothetical protein
MQSWHYDTATSLRILRHRTQALLSEDYGPAGVAGAWATPPHPPGPEDRLRDYRPAGAADNTAEPSAPQDLPGTTDQL